MFCFVQKYYLEWMWSWLACIWKCKIWKLAWFKLRQSCFKHSCTCWSWTVLWCFLFLLFFFVGRYFDEISQDTGKFCFGVEDTLKVCWNTLISFSCVFIMYSSFEFFKFFPSASRKALFSSVSSLKRKCLLRVFCISVKDSRINMNHLRSSKRVKWPVNAIFC